MSARQYLPIYLDIFNDLTIMVYPAKDESPLTDITDKEKLIKSIKKTYAEHEDILQKGNYHIIFAWNRNGSLMLDVWVHTDNTHSDSGPLLEFYGYSDGMPSSNKDIASGDTVVILGREEEKRRKFKSTEDYLQDRSLPHVPEYMIPNEEFA